MEDRHRPPSLRWQDTDDAAPATAEEPDGGSPAVRARIRAPGAHADSVTGAVLACVVEGLEVAGIEHFLVERNRSGSRVAVAAAHVDELWAALRELGATSPLHAAVVAGEEASWSGLARDLPAPAPGPGELEQVALHADVVDPVSGLVLGEKQACVLEPWVDDEHGGLRAPRPNARTEDVTAEDRRAPTLADLGDQYVTVVPPFDRPDVFEVAFDVDAVILWVDGSDPHWRQARERRREELGLPPEGAGTAERLYADHGELRYLLRSLERYAPWLRHLYLVTAGQRPAWLRTDHPWLTLVDHADIVERSALPTFSPRPVTARMHRIEGLAEHFLYLNDDMILTRALRPELFFAANGQSKFFLSKATTPRHDSELPHFGGRQLVQRLLYERYGVHVTRTFRHAPYAMTRTTLQMMEREFGDELAATVHRPFRSPDDIVPEWLHHYLGFLEGTAMPAKITYGFLPIGRASTVVELKRLLTRRRFDTICLNDHGDEDAAVADTEPKILRLLERLLPGHGSLETDGQGGDATAGPASA